MKIECKNLRKSYGETPILRFRSLPVEAGEFLGITGENGSGKSTLLHILAGLDTQFEGTVRYGENRPFAEVARDVTLVMQKPYMLKRSVRQNLDYPLRLRGIDPAERKRRVEESARDYGLSSLLDKRADRLSGGEMQKLNLARALIFRPRLLLLDEPTANVDRAFTEKIEQMLMTYYETNRPTILLVTHNQDQARRLCGRVIHLQRGEEYAVL